MIQWKNIKLILLRELKDQMRDRRTLFMVAVLPLLLYPAMGIGMVQMTVLFSEQPRNVVVLGAKDLPEHPQLLEGDHFVSNWFRMPSDADKLRVITDIDPAETSEAAADVTQAAERKAILEQARKLEVVLKKHQELLNQWEQLEDQDDPEQEALLANKITETNERLSKLFAESQIQVLILIPKGLSQEIERVSEKLARHEKIDFDPADSLRPLILQNNADEKSMIAYRRVDEAMEAWEKEILRARLSRANLPESLPTPVNPDVIDLAQDEQLAANLWSKLFPALLIIMAATGAFYPAIDLGAGEKSGAQWRHC